MDIDWVRQFCLSLPNTTEHIQWEHLVFKVGSKMFSMVALEPSRSCMSFKTSPEEFAELTEHPRIIPAPYLARAQWISLESEEALPRDEVCRLLRKAHSLVFAKLPKKTQHQLSAPRKPPRRRSHRSGT